MPNPGAELDNFLRKQNSPLVGYGQTFVQVGQKYGIDPKLLVAISGAESSFGTKTKAGTYNPFGWGPHRPLGSWENAIETVGKGLKTGYFDQGLTTPEAIGKKWAPLGAGNDPTNLNANWAGNVNKFLAQLGGSATLGSPGGAQLPSPKRPSSPAGSSSSRQAALEFIFGEGFAGILPEAPVSPSKGKGTSSPLRVRGKAPKGAQGLVELAKSFIGTPYSWGGGNTSGPSRGFGRGANTVGFDCSSFLQFLAAKTGKAISRTTYTQWREGAAIPKNQLQVGDAVFFNMGKDGPGHVGMFIGNGKFIEAPRTGLSIRVSTLAGRKGFVGARRLF